MALIYLVNKPQVLKIIARWLLLFLEYGFTIVYKLSKTHVIAYVLNRLLDVTEPSRVPKHTTNASLLFT
jgi:hypothetical protein